MPWMSEDEVYVGRDFGGREVEITPDLVRPPGKGLMYAHGASSYVFRRTGRHPCAGYEPSW